MPQRSDRQNLREAIAKLAQHQGLRDRNNVYRDLLLDTVMDSSREDFSEMTAMLARSAVLNDGFDLVLDAVVQQTEGGASPVGFTPTPTEADPNPEPVPGFFDTLIASVDGIQNPPPANPNDTGVEGELEQTSAAEINAGLQEAALGILDDAFKFCGNYGGRLPQTGFDKIAPFFYSADGKSPNIKTIIYGGDVVGLTEEQINCTGPISKSAPTINIIELREAWCQQSVTDTNIVKLFAQGIPSTIMSQAVPYFDVKIIDATSSAVVASGGGYKVGNSMSATKFIKGFGNLEDIDKQVLEATVAGAPPPTAEEGKEVIKPSIAGMELFTMPQTFVGEVKPYVDLSLDGLGDNPTRKNSILDPFRPLMTVKSFTCNTEVSNVVMATIRGSMDIVLHDRSRMHEIAPLLRPDRSGNQEVLIEFGWSHPRTDTAYGQLINCCRQKRKFIVMGTDYNFDTTGAVNITVNLISKGFQTVGLDLPTGMPGGAIEMERLQEIVETISKNLEDDILKDVYQKIPVGKFRSVSSIMTISADDFKKVKEAVDEYKKGNLNKSETTKTLLKNIEEATGRVKNYRDATSKAFDLIKKLINRTIVANDKVPGKDSAHDPWASDWTEIKGKLSEASFSTKTHISLGRLLSIFTIPKIIGKGTFDCIDFVYGAVNDDAYGLSFFKSIAQIPVPKSEIITTMDILRETTPNPPLIAVISFIMEFVTKWQGKEGGWGLGGAVKTSIDADTGKIVKEFQAKSKDEYNDRLTKASKQYYGDSRRMVIPKFVVDVESVPLKGDPSKTMLRIKIIDAQQDNYKSYGDMIRSVTSSGLRVLTDPSAGATEKTPARELAYRHLEKMNSAGLIKKVDRPPLLTAELTGGNEYLKDVVKYEVVVKDAASIKAFLHEVMPTFKYGTEHTIIKGATVSANTDQQQMKINLARATSGAGRPAGTEAAETVPYEVIPGVLSLSTVGCPFITFGQQYFFDYQTNTSIDNIYIVTGTEHQINPQGFTTNIQLQLVGYYGTFEGLQTKFSEIQDGIMAEQAKFDAALEAAIEISTTA